MTQEIKLGMIVRDPVTGLQGTTSVKSEALSGSVQFCIQPVGNGEKVEEAHFIDDFLLEVVDEGVSAKLTPPDSSVTLRVGEEAQDLVTGMKGIATDKYTHLNGCVFFYLVPKAERGAAEAPKGVYLEHKRLKRLGNGLAPKQAPVARMSASAPLEEPKPRTGGPNRSARSVFGR